MHSTPPPRAPGSFSSVRNFQRYSGRSVTEVRKFLAGRDAYTMRKPRNIWFPRRGTFSKSIADLYYIDLADVWNLSPFNDGIRYLLTCIDVFFHARLNHTDKKQSPPTALPTLSKRSWAKGRATWCRATRVPNFSIRRFSPCYANTAYISARAKTRTWKPASWSVSTELSRLRCTDISPTRIRDDTWTCWTISYNNTYHRSIGMAPAEVGPHNENDVRARLYPLKPKCYK